MFADLHALAQSATLLIAVSTEGDLLRVGVTPIQSGDKTKPHALRPLSLLGTPAELDADFGAALIAWQAPKKSIVEQAADAAGAPDEDDDDDEKAAPSSKPKQAAPKTEKGKPGPKKKTAPEPAQPAAEKLADESGAAAAPAEEKEPEFELLPTPAGNPNATDEPKEEPRAIAPPAAPVVDDKTLDLF